MPLFNPALPSQAGQSGKFLTTNGTVASWAAGGGGGVTAPYTLAGVGNTVPFTTNAIAGQTAKLQSWQVNSVEKAYLDATGTFYGLDMISTSDARLKTDVETISGALDKVMGMRGVNFTRIGDTRRRVGLIAQEVDVVLPEVVTADQDGMLAISYPSIVGLLVEAIKEQQQEIDAMKVALNIGSL